MKKSLKGGVYCEVYPQGENSEGQRLETIGFVLEHGRAGRTMKKRGKNKGKTVTIRSMAPHPWMEQAMSDAQDDIASAMDAEWQKM